MGPCCVEGCELTTEETFYFEFPTSRTLRRKWLELIPIPGKLLLGTVVCSRHFSTSDYENVRGKVRLKSKVVPSLLLDAKKPPPNDTSPNVATSPAPAKEDKQKSPPPKPAKSPSPSPEAEKEQGKSPTEKTRSHIKRARSSIQQDKTVSPSKRDRLPSERDRSPTERDSLSKDRDRSPMQRDNSSKNRDSSSKERDRSPLQRDSSSKERDRSSKDRDRSPMEGERSPNNRNRSPNNRDRSPTERDRSPVHPPKARSPSPTKPETTEVPSLMDAEKLIDDLQKEALSNKTKVGKKHNGVSRERLPLVQSAPPPPPAPPIDQKEDIEDMITNYHIKNKVPNPALLADLAPPQTETGGCPPLPPLPPPLSETIEIEDMKEAEPVFIELSVDKDGTTTGGGNEDCLMVLESVQVDVDPSTLLLAQDDDYYRDEEEPKNDNRKDDPISLLTSSDEDDVILQEPHIDTVEVSDETDEDDKPLVTLVKNKPTKKMKVLKKKPKDGRRKFRWSLCDFYCVHCHYSTNDSLEYNKHLSTHSTVLQVCSICSYTSASKSNFARHTRNHKVEKKFKCHLCEYKARHKMSLIYHLKSHDPQELNAAPTLANFICKNCNYRSSDKVKIFRHLQTCDGIKRHYCDNCDYVTKKRSDLKRHRSRKHPEECADEDGDIDCEPKSNGDKTVVRLVE